MVMNRLSWIVTLLSTVVALALVVFRAAWLPLAEKAFALVGAIWVVLPFFRDNRLREMW